MEVNAELLSHIHSATFYRGHSELSKEDLEALEPTAQVVMRLKCDEVPEMKLKRTHMAVLTVAEAMIYINLGIKGEEQC